MSDYGSDDVSRPPKPFKERRVAKPRKVTEERLYNAAIHYLQRFSATEAHLAAILQRKVKRWTEQEPDFAIGADEKIKTVTAKIVALGFVNDALFAESRTRTLRRQGKSSSTIRMHLKQKGVTDDVVLSGAMQKGDHSFLDEITPHHDTPSHDDIGHDDDITHQQAEQQALARFIKRKRLFQSDDPEQKQKDIAKALRAGFSWSLIRAASENN
jgi:SOS response regulatory protein OraA/RecX